MGTLSDAVSFIESFDTFMLSTHSGPDADGIGAELLMAALLRSLGKKARIINADKISSRFSFMDPDNFLEVWNSPSHFHFPAQSALILLDTSDELHLGILADEAIPNAQAVFVIDHHEPNPFLRFDGYINSDSSSTCELVLNLANHYQFKLDKDCASAAYAGLVYDTGSFIYPKTSTASFKAALQLVKAGAVPHDIHRLLHENANIGALLLQKQVLSTLELHAEGRIAVQTLSKKDLENCEASYEDAESFVNLPLKSKDVEISIFVKEQRNGMVRCSLRSKGQVNVSLIAQNFSGGGHKTAAGFKSSMGLDKTREEVVQRVLAELEIL